MGGISALFAFVLYVFVDFRNVSCAGLLFAGDLSFFFGRGTLGPVRSGYRLCPGGGPLTLALKDLKGERFITTFNYLIYVLCAFVFRMSVSFVPKYVLNPITYVN